MKPNCYECKYRGTIPGDAHSCCQHPKIGKPFDLFERLYKLLSGEMVQEINEFGITAEPYGIRMGWFFWPVNFDPVWLLSCKMFEQRDTQ